MKIPFFLVDTFASQPFAGAVTAVLLPDEPLAPELYAPIVDELGAHVGSFVTRHGSELRVRFFDRRAELALCTHAAIGAAHTVATALQPGQPSVTLVSASGPLVVQVQDGQFVTDLPRLPPGPCDDPGPLTRALRVPPAEVLRAGKYVAVYNDESDLRTLGDAPPALSSLDATGVIATAPGKHHDFVYRSFAVGPAGVYEEPVSASALGRLVPYWSKRLGRTSFAARQLSPRGAEMRCEDVDGRVRVSGRAIRVAEGTFFP